MRTVCGRVFGVYADPMRRSCRLGSAVLVALAAAGVLPQAAGARVSAAPVLVAVRPGQYSTPKVTIRYPVGVYSGEVEWDFINLAGSPMSVTDSTGLKLFDTGPRHSPATFHYIFKWAGNYPYHSTSDGTRGLVRVTMTRHPGKGALGTGFTLTWASAGRKNCVFDVEVHRPGATRWGFAKFATTALTGTFTPRAVGWYAIRSRIRNTVTKTYSKFSPSVLIHVT
jgi:hypothetical protein